MESLTPIEWRVLEVTAGMPGDLEHLYQRLHVPLADAADAVRSLVEKGILSPRFEVTPLTDVVDRLLRSEFAPTPKGREALTAEPAATPHRRSLYGVFKDRNIHLTREDVDEARREMWSNFDRDDPR